MTFIFLWLHSLKVIISGSIHVASNGIISFFLWLRNIPFYIYIYTYMYVYMYINLTYFFKFIFISWRLITLQYCSGFCHTLTWISHGSTCVPHAEPPSHFPPHPIPLGHPSATAQNTCLMHPTWTGDLFHTW